MSKNKGLIFVLVWGRCPLCDFSSRRGDYQDAWGRMIPEFARARVWRNVGFWFHSSKVRARYSHVFGGKRSSCELKTSIMFEYVQLYYKFNSSLTGGLIDVKL